MKLFICTLTAVILQLVFVAQAKLPDKSQIMTDMQRVADWQIEHFHDDMERENEWENRFNAWTYGALYIGMEKWAKMAPTNKYYEFLLDVAAQNNWDLGPGKYHADDQAVGQLYIELYRKYKKPHMLAKTLDRTNWIMNNPSTQPMRLNHYKYTERWTWCDALFMAPPVWAKLANITNNDDFRDWMFAEYVATVNHLYDKQENLFYRDEHFIHERDNGHKIFWSRGNGWVFGGLTLILEELPQGPQKAYFTRLYKDMAASLIALQTQEGHWAMSLKAAALYPTPETSGTAFFTYGLAWGVNNGYLDKNTYLPTIERGWQSLTSHITSDGMLGYVQPVGAGPGDAWPDKTEVYGVGAFLSAGSELYKLAQD
ncbi:glycoside hydrolase family 88/105 protein [Alteromonas gilva]|uniref:Glycoside hydrolase family 88 protein n=1 Tax=Alteromonas gilva TaxID=2987522 RepID=A0ABT5L526_9ALTE|nr:glycoside hydrolase family 88 protein [Alteromonas gilva]MDC8831962.1 glycoside hydrolase family 88 protein [Alteromonas gilva]